MSKVFILGASGFLGQAICAKYPDSGVPINRLGMDFRIREDALCATASVRDEIVINACGRVGGIGANRSRPYDFYLDNLLIGTNLMDTAFFAGASKYVQIGTVCSYPKDGAFPMGEDQFWAGLPEETNGYYGLAKKNLVTQGMAMSKQYGFNVINPILANLYGPGDHFDGLNSHVIPDMIRKFSQAVEINSDEVVLWGTGKCSREFLYVEDAAEAIKFLVDRYDSPEIINVVSGDEIMIRDLAEIIADQVGFKGHIKWDASKPDGQPRRKFDGSKLASLGWSAKTKLADGIKAAIADYSSRRTPVNV